jgi:hypothetical protein
MLSSMIESTRRNALPVWSILETVTMSKAAIAGAAVVGAVLVLVLALVASYPAVEPGVGPAGETTRPVVPSTAASAVAHGHAGFLYGRITADDGTYEGRLRWGGDQEAFWVDYFDGLKAENPWAAYVPGEPSPFEIFGFEIGGPDRPNRTRPFIARFGDIARVDAQFKSVRLTLKSGTTVSLDRFAAGDIDDGVRVWDIRRGAVDLDSRRIRAIEFLPTPPLAEAPDRLYGVVRTRQGEFSGFIQWNERDGASTDTLQGRTGDRELSLRYDSVRSIARHSRDSARVTLRDGSDVVLSGHPDVGRGHRGIYVDDTRYGRVLISWDAFESADFSTGGSGPAYGDFPPGRPLAGIVTTRDGRRFAGRLVYDLDESETTDTLDVSADDVTYNLPFGLIASIAPRGGDGRVPSRAVVTLAGGGELHVEHSGDLGERNAGMLIFVDGQERPEYVPWTDVERVDLGDLAGAGGER